MEILTVVCLIFGISLSVMYWFWRPAPSIGNATNQEQGSFIETYVFPSFMEHKIKENYPHLTNHQVAQVLTGLRDFFHACQQASRIMVGMPSQVVDAAWHEIILDTREYHYFCERAFERFLHHTPAEAMPTEGDTQEGNSAPYCAKQIGCTWVPNRQDPPKRLETISPHSRRGTGSCGGCLGSSCGSGCGGD